MFRATTRSNEAFESWVKDSDAYKRLDAAAQSLVRRAFAHGWNSAVGSFLPCNSQSEQAFSLSDEIDTLMGELAGEPDRSVAIVGLAFIDEALATAIAAASVDSDRTRKVIEDKLSNYSTRYHLAFCLGYFGEQSLADFAALGWVRNQFAHRRKRKPFADADIRERCLGLCTVNAIQGWTGAEPRQYFITAVAVISFYLAHRARMEPQRLSWGNVWQSE